MPPGRGPVSGSRNRCCSRAAAAADDDEQADATTGAPTCEAVEAPEPRPTGAPPGRPSHSTRIPRMR